MKISNAGPGKAVSKTAKKGGAKGSAAASGNFSTHLNKAPSANAGGPEIGDIAPMAAMDSILALQEVGNATDEEGRRVLYQRGEDILDRLSEIQREILSGSLSKERLQNLAHLLRSRRENVDDPDLAQIIDEIELRAEVEIAKWTRSK